MNIKRYIQKYKKDERLGAGHLSADHVRAAFPLTFLMHGYPTQIRVFLDLLKYVDTMQELSNLDYFFNQMFVNDIEKKRINEISSLVGSITECLFRKRIEPWIGPLATLPVARAVNCLSNSIRKKSLNILEIGSGSGYLVAHLGKMGHRVFATDTTEGFYLWQNIFWKKLFGKDFFEASLFRPFADFSHLKNKIVHLPWWVFFSCYKSSLPKIDLVICDHAFGEMYPYGYKYVVALIKLLAQNNPNLFVLYESFGEPRFQGPNHLNNDLALFQFTSQSLAFFTCLLHENNPFKSRLRISDFSLCKIQGPQNGHYHAGRTCVLLQEKFAPKSIEFYRFLGFKTPTEI